MPSSLSAYKVIQLGDNVVFLPVIQEFVARKIFESITIWTSPLAADLYRNLGIKVRSLPRHEFNAAWRNPLTLIRLLRSAKSDRCEFSLIAEDQGNVAFFLARLASRYRIGIRPRYLSIPGAITHPVEIPSTAHAADKAWAIGRKFAEMLNIPDWPEFPPAPDIAHLIDSDAGSKFDFLIHPGASLSYQRWAEDRFVELARRLAAFHSVAWIHTSGLPPQFDHSGPQIIHSQDLRALVTALSRCHVFIGNNSGPMHLASALGCHGLIIMGPSASVWDPYWWPERFRILLHEALPCIRCDLPGEAPRGHCTNLEQPMECMNFWSVEELQKLARAHLETAKLECLRASSQL